MPRMNSKDIRETSVAEIDVCMERDRQRDIEGFTSEGDDRYVNGELAMAAVCYANPKNDYWSIPPEHWPWSGGWWKPKSRRENLVRAGALIMAEIERLDRLENTNE